MSRILAALTALSVCAAAAGAEENPAKPAWRALSGPTAAVWTVAISSDGRRVAAAGEAGGDKTRGGEVRLWESGTGESTRSIQEPSGPVAAVALSPDGRTIAAAAGDGIRLWDATDGRLLQTISGDEAVSALAWSRDGTRLLSQSAWRGQGEIRLRTPSGQLAASVLDAKGVFSAFSLSADGKTLATAGHSTRDGRRFLRLWDARTGRLRRTLDDRNNIAAVALSPDGATLAAASASHLNLWDARTGNVIRILDESFLSVVFSADGRRLAGLTSDRIVLLDPKTWTNRRTLELGSPGLCFALSDDGATLVTGHGDSSRGEVRVWNLPPPGPAAAKAPPPPAPAPPRKGEERARGGEAAPPDRTATDAAAAARAGAESLKSGKDFICGSAGVTQETPLADVIDGLGDKLALRPTKEPCRHDLIYERSGSKPRVLSKSPGMYLVAVGRRFKTAERDRVVVCASAISHSRAVPPPGKAPEDLNRRVDAVSLDCAALIGGRWTPTNTVVAGGEAWACWIQAVEQDPAGGPDAYKIRFARDSTFQFMNTKAEGRPPTDGIYEARISVDPKTGPAASSTVKASNSPSPPEPSRP